MTKIFQQSLRAHANTVPNDIGEWGDVASKLLDLADDEIERLEKYNAGHNGDRSQMHLMISA